MKAFISGGGTGGHFYPAAAVAQELKKRDIKVYYFGTKKGIESKRDFPCDQKHLFEISGVRGRNIIKGILSSLGLLKTTFDIVRIIKKEKPDFSLCFGGYSSLPLGMASIITGTPLFIHEQNSVPSYTNLLLSKFSKKIFITFPHSQKFFNKNKTVLTGIPIRNNLKEDIKMSKEEARKILNLQNKPVVLVFGGSQGSKKLSITGIQAAKKLKNYQFIIIGGRFFKKPDDLPENVIFLQYYDRMGVLYSASDIIISRSGAASTYEIAVSGKPALLVPYPYAASDHQFFNALWLKEKAAAKIIREDDLNVDILIEKINFLIKKTPQKDGHIKTDAEIQIIEGILNEIGRL